MNVANESIGSARIPEAKGAIPPTPGAQIETAVAELAARAEAWIDVDIDGRIALIKTLRRDTAAVAEEWVAAACEAKGIRRGDPCEGEEWLGGPFTTLRNLRLLERTLKQIRDRGRPQAPGPVTTRPDGTVTVGVFPGEPWDKLLYTGMTAEIWMQEGVTAQNLADHQGMIYRTKALGERPKGKVALVLGAGNVASIGPMDALYKLFAEDQVVILKMNPVNAYLGPFIARAFGVLVDRGFLRIVYGGAEEGRLLCQHEDVAEIHITGSDKTHDAIVFGGGEAGAQRKAAGEPINTRRISSELGNVSPVIVVPGPWSSSDLAFQGANIASSLANNAGFNCNATRVIITHDGWPQRGALLDRIRDVFRATPTRRAYYPGARDRMASFLAAHPDAEQLGDGREDGLPWTLVGGLDPEARDDICYRTEAFCSVTSEVGLEAGSVGDYIDRAVSFCNDIIWGTLNAALIVHPKSLQDPRVAEAVERAIGDLRYGAVAINHWPAIVYGLVTTTWGGYPGHTPEDIGSGIGVVHNTYLYDRPLKSVMRGPFRMSPKPPWFVTNRNSHKIGRKLTKLEASGSWLTVPGVALAALRG